jgi:hypothetical protein
MKTRSGPDRFCVSLLRTCFKEGKSIEEEAEKMRLDDRERRKLVQDYVELTKIANKQKGIKDEALVLPDF